PHLSRVFALATRRRPILLFCRQTAGFAVLRLEQTAPRSSLHAHAHLAAVLGSPSRAHLELRLLEPLCRRVFLSRFSAPLVAVQEHLGREAALLPLRLLAA